MSVFHVSYKSFYNEEICGEGYLSFEYDVTDIETLDKMYIAIEYYLRKTCDNIDETITIVFTSINKIL